MMRHMPARASTSAMARWATLLQPNASAIWARLWLESRGSAMRESASVSIHVSDTSGAPAVDSTKWRSKVALCASTGMPPTNRESSVTACRARGASATSSFEIPVRSVISFGMA